MIVFPNIFTLIISKNHKIINNNLISILRTILTTDNE